MFCLGRVVGHTLHGVHPVSQPREKVSGANRQPPPSIQTHGSAPSVTPKLRQNGVKPQNGVKNVPEEFRQSQFPLPSASIFPR